MRRFVTIDTVGGPEVMQLHQARLGAPAATEVTIDQAFAGVNFIDTYHRSGAYPLPLPAGLGMEAAGVVSAVGEAVTTLRVGDRVAYVAPAPGSYCTARNMDARFVTRLPADIPLRHAAGALLKGLTAWYLLCRTYPVRAGETIVVHAAAGGTGSLLVAWASALGARVIGTAGGAEKCRQARANGAWRCIDYERDDFTEAVRDLTTGRGVPVVFDGVGAATFDGSLRCLQHRGLMVSFGNASGPVRGVQPSELARAGSLFLTRPSLFHYIEAREEYLAGCEALFSALRSGTLPLHVTRAYSLAEVANAHHDLQARRTTGSLVLQTSSSDDAAHQL